MGNAIGNIFRFTIWGQSHSPGIGVTIEGIPAGTRIDLERLQAFLDRRRPGQDRYSTTRSEADTPDFVAGFLPDEAVTCGAPVTAVIRNANTRSGDYENLRFVPRPGHADFAAMVKYGSSRDVAGGGQFSGRLTAPLCIAGGIALQILEKKGVRISARPVMIGGETEEDRMLAAIDRARGEGDSVGGIVECVVEGVPAGVGEPMFDGIENRIAQMVFGIPAVKGIEFGAGFAAAGMRGSENNDPFLSADSCRPDPAGSYPADPGSADSCPADPGSADSRPADPDFLSRVHTASNHHGGALGGISSGMPIVFRAAFKPTPSIAGEQDSIDVRTGQAVKLQIKGRHDPCIVLRAVPVVEAAAAAAVYDLLLQAALT